MRMRDPSFSIPMTPSAGTATATHTPSRSHEICGTPLTEGGRLSVVQVAPASVALAILDPETQQASADEHLTPSYPPYGSTTADQVLPPSTVWSTGAPPASSQQLPATGQFTGAMRYWAPGMTCSLQVRPPSVVLHDSNDDCRNPLKVATATRDVPDGQSIDTDVPACRVICSFDSDGSSGSWVDVQWAPASAVVR